VEQTYSVREFAEQLDVSAQTVYRWIYDGVLQTIQVVPYGPRRIPASELVRLTTPKTETQRNAM